MSIRYRAGFSGLRSVYIRIACLEPEVGFILKRLRKLVPIFRLTNWFSINTCYKFSGCGHAGKGQKRFIGVYRNFRKSTDG
ncbi:hypothetical protein CRP01_33050 [Flavilitoribacter nigricans DSM 23189 = NBRC 102662]|uniref:Uncharacterized protein n=1 Tax=Flavilitoribacter nigricans (strain ATCC 23147 / DSM 23189 / NBRC 102662 / NCIMB 1420 / SS-2) TaxID=1122177 RepID=A0A2D0N1T4_FLAN2|nr:hypothetical protein CRP01_33050 [Flavilitoribacter nigricans DSM 23189 = NBRC 102662]